MKEKRGRECAERGVGLVGGWEGNGAIGYAENEERTEGNERKECDMYALIAPIAMA